MTPPEIKSGLHCQHSKDYVEHVQGCQVCRTDFVLIYSKVYKSMPMIVRSMMDSFGFSPNEIAKKIMEYLA